MNDDFIFDKRLSSSFLFAHKHRKKEEEEEEEEDDEKEKEVLLNIINRLIIISDTNFRFLLQYFSSLSLSCF